MKYVSRSVRRSESGGGARFPVQDLSLGRYCERGTCATESGRTAHTPKIEPERENASLNRAEYTFCG